MRVKRDIPLSSPSITNLERKAVLDVLHSRNLSLGPKLDEFEDSLANYIGVRYAVAVNSGTSALHLSVKALGLKEGDEVITTPFSFIASSNCLLYEKVIPKFVDINPYTLNINVNEIEAKITKKTKAILPVHVFGQPCDMDPILKIAEMYDLKIIEDSCEAIGAAYKNKKVGTFGECGVFAFYPNKQITTGEGGAVVTNNNEIAELCKSLRNQGRSCDGSGLSHERLGYNYRLSDIQCALGIAQLERIDELLTRREKVAGYYNTRLKGTQGVLLPKILPEVKISWFVYVVIMEDQYTSKQRDQIISGLRRQGIGCSNYFPPIHLQPFYVDLFGYKREDFPMTERISDRTIALPFSANLNEGDVDVVVETLKKEIACL